MATGRTVTKFARAYVDGYDLSGFMVDPGLLSSVYSQIGGAHMSDAVKGYLPGQATNSVGPINAMFDNTASGLHDMVAADTVRTVMVALGIQAAPAVNDPVFAGDFLHLDHIVISGGEEIAVSAIFQPATLATTLSYDNPWGKLALEKSVKTAANTATATIDYGAQTAFGGYACFHLFSSDGTATLKIQDSATNIDGNFSDLISSGVIDASVTPVGSIVALATTATVERYIRWQVALGTATTVTMAMSFHRAIR
jgi:hypothetical protein